MKTYVAKASEIERKWILIDAEGQILGRLATEIATILRGKHKPEYTPFLDTGDHVVVINAEKVVVTGNKASDKLYRRHSMYPGGMKEVSYTKMMQTHPERILEAAVRGMLPKNSLGRQMFRKLKVVIGSEHNFHAQKPEKLER